ncbi:polysaccharide biosynthesis/export family protein [uncultured Lamprocystis sp.]|jgi:polysaccharide export outer membrane protein|uniref:SLBB domain-containing protein n=1 Tax=uncultured Lamprocystis sp. TaxID=543132 RepID=UPI0025D361F7|nr:polysaccharide biosynthesis/export family protein [uncultured Lamprocystis sp.]
MRRNSIVLVFIVLFLGWSLGAPADQSYRLGANDVVRVTVYGHPDLSTIARVAENGGVTIPIIGEVALGGLTGREAELKIQSLLTEQKIVKSPQVTLIVDKYESQRVSVLGEVVRPGVYPITRGSSLMDLISEAGGLREEAGEVAIVTRKNEGPSSGRVIDLVSLLEGSAATPEPTVTDGDRIFVPRMERFYIYGQVNKPGAYRLERGMTVMQALSVASGITDKGTERGIKIRRKSSAGAEQEFSAQLTQQIQANDVIYVNESIF